MGMKDTEKVPFDSMPPLIRCTFLTKEQVEKLKEPFKDVVSVVRCKNCKKQGLYDCYITSLTGQTSSDDWFCADGERKENEG